MLLTALAARGSSLPLAGTGRDFNALCLAQVDANRVRLLDAPDDDASNYINASHIMVRGGPG